MTLSIIIPTYNAEPYIDDLLKCLLPQLNDETELIVVDDGSDFPFLSPYPGIKVIRKENGGPASARNAGLNSATGKYISFIDADDLVSDDYVKKIFEKIKIGFDICEFSWKTLGNGPFMDYKLKTESDRLTNPSACTRCFRKSFIAKTRFTELKDACEDEDFSRRLGYLDHDNNINISVINDYLYFYRNYVPESNTKRYKQGLCKTKRIVYYFDQISADRTDLLEEIKREDKYNEVWLLTNKCELPELKRYCQISKPMFMWTHYLRGEPYTNCEIIDPPIQAQVVFFINQLNVVGGIETYIYNIASVLGKYYDMILVVGNLPQEQFNKLSKVIPIIKDRKQRIQCDTLIMLRILDDRPSYIQAKQVIRTVHACRTNPAWKIPKDCDKEIHVSQASKESFGSDGIVIHNPFVKEKKKALFLISATRIPALDKGNNERRMMTLCKMLNDADIPFIWLNFSDGRLDNAPKGFYNMGVDTDIQPYIARADYLVQLSDSEAYSYSVLEALTNNTPVICTPFQSATESGVIDGLNGYIIPFDMGFDVNKLLKVPKFKDDHNNDDVVMEYRKLLGNTTPKSPYKPTATVSIRAIKDYTDSELNRYISTGTIYEVTQYRANVITGAGFAERI